MTVSHTTGTGPITYGSTGNSDATFVLGLTLYQPSAPRALQPNLMSGAWPVYAGGSGSVTLNEAALGAAPFSYQWLSDNGGGGALTPVNGGTTSNLVVNIGVLAAGNYNYAVVVSNAFGISISPGFTLNVLGPTAPSLTTDIAPAPVNTGNVGDTVQYTASFTGTPPISYQWMFNHGYGPTPISTIGNPSAGSNTLTLSNLQLTNGGVYSVAAQNYAGSVTSSVSTLVMMPPVNSPPPGVTVPPVFIAVFKQPGFDASPMGSRHASAGDQSCRALDTFGDQLGGEHHQCADDQCDNVFSFDRRQPAAHREPLLFFAATRIFASQIPSRFFSTPPPSKSNCSSRQTCRQPSPCSTTPWWTRITRTILRRSWAQTTKSAPGGKLLKLWFRARD